MSFVANTNSNLNKEAMWHMKARFIKIRHCSCLYDVGFIEGRTLEG